MPHVDDIFLFTPELKRLMSAHRENSGQQLDSQIATQIAIKEAHFSPTANFTPDAFNQINALYYSQQDFAFYNRLGLARAFDDCPPLTRAIAYLMKSKATSQGKLDITELSIGAKAHAWVETANHLSDLEIHLTATDIKDPKYHFDKLDFIPQNLTIKYQIANMLNLSSVKLPANQDIIYCTYLFDTIWMRNDLHLIKGEDGQWFQQLFRVKVTELAPHRDRFVQQLKNAHSPTLLDRHDFEAIMIEHITVPFDIAAFEHGKQIKEVHEDKKPGFSLNFPGGLIESIQYLTKYLKPGGCFILGEIAAHAENQDIVMRPCEKTGLIARFQVEDYVLAKAILEALGYAVDIMTFDKLADKYLLKGWEGEYKIEDVKLINGNPNSCVVVITRK